jgi:hypothetical protein
MELKAMDEAKPLRPLLGSTGTAFLDFVKAHPECLARTSFAALDRRDEFLTYPMQPWPTFVDAKFVEEMAAAAVATCRLVKSVPQRIFAADPDRLARYYALERDRAAMMAELLADRERVGGMLARGDFIHTGAGFQCLEMNVNANIGGWQVPILADLYRSVPLIAQFLRERSLRVGFSDPVRLLFEHLVREAQRTRVVDDVLICAFVVPPENSGGAAVEAYASRELRRVLAAHPGALSGDAVFCAREELRFAGGRVSVRGRRIHVLLDHYEVPDAAVDRQVFACAMAGTLDLYNGPASGILADKRNLALLSQARDGGAYSAAERETIRRYIPWTREVKRGYTDYAGQPVRMDALLASRRERLVLKHARSAAGTDVYLGRGMGSAQWDALARRALAEPGAFVVQEYLESAPFVYQAGAAGCGPYDLIWGMFVFGETYGGACLRMLSQGSNAVVNAAQGANIGIIFEVDDTPPAAAPLSEPGA